MDNELFSDTILDHFLSRIKIMDCGAGSPCWVWRGSKNNRGYGTFRVNSQWVELTHRFIFMEVHGDLPAGLQIDHLCRNKACCNPEHLEAVTGRENVRRRDKARKPIRN